MKNTLIRTNPYLNDPEQRHSLLYTSISSSTAIEGVHAAVAKISFIKKPIEHGTKEKATHKKSSSGATKKPT